MPILGDVGLTFAVILHFDFRRASGRRLLTQPNSDSETETKRGAVETPIEMMVHRLSRLRGIEEEAYLTNVRTLLSPWWRVVNQSDVGVKGDELQRFGTAVADALTNYDYAFLTVNGRLTVCVKRAEWLPPTVKDLTQVCCGWTLISL